MGAAGEVVRVGVEEGFRRWAEVYDDVPNPLLALEERMLVAKLPEMDGRCVVDVGCGTGRWLERLALRGAKRLLGIDSSAEMLRRAQQKLRGSSILIRSTCTAIPLADGCADVILCSFTIGYADSLDDVARELERICRPGGDIYISEFHPDTHARGWRRRFRHRGDQVEITNVAHSIGELSHAFRRHSFDSLEIEEPCFGEPEREYFVRAGKPEMFDQSASAPAIFLAHFRRRRTKRTFAMTRRTGLQLACARVAVDANTATEHPLNICDGRIVSASAGFEAGFEPVDLSGYLLLPGLINAHDHLEFNLFPRLGEGPYGNFLDWATDIHCKYAQLIASHRAVDKTTRMYWGAIKNLLAGVTTVAHHNPYEPETFGNNFPVRVVRRFGWAHSVPLQTDIGAAYANTPADAPFLIHVAEGTDQASAEEFGALNRQGFVGPRTVLVHAVGLTAGQREELRVLGAAVVWCPSSNLFTLGKTLSAADVSTLGRVALGTDSALTGDGDLRDEMRLARKLGVSAARLYAMVTTSAADVLRLSDGEGTVGADGIADVIAMRDDGRPPAEALCASDHAIELVISGGVVRMISPELAARWSAPLTDMEEICVGGVRRLVKAPVAHLLRSVQHLGNVHVAHKQVTH